MPNHYTNVLIIFGGYDEDNEHSLSERLNADKWGDAPFQRVLPMPDELNVKHLQGGMHPPWYTWRNEHWGVKWEAYDVQPIARLPGDGSPTQITFCTAWGAPGEALRDVIWAELRDKYGATAMRWIGADPYNDTIPLVGEWTT